MLPQEGVLEHDVCGERRGLGGLPRAVPEGAVAVHPLEELLPVESLTEPAEGVFVVQTRKLSTAEMNAAAEKLNARGEVRAAMRIL